MLRKWSVVVSAAVLLGSVGMARAEGPTADSERKFQVNNREVHPRPDAGGRRQTMGLLRLSVNDAPSHKVNLKIDQDLTGKAEHKLVIEDMTANLKLDYTLNPQTSEATIVFKNSTVRVAPGPNGSWSVEGKMFPDTQATARALAQDGRLAGVSPELLGGLVTALDVVLGGPSAATSTAPRLDVAWQAATVSGS